MKKFILLAFLLVTSCNYRDIAFEYYQSSDIRLDVDWSRFVEETPTGMSVYCYNVKDPSKGPYIYLSNDISGVKISLPIGTYNIVVFNQSISEFGSLRFTGMEKFETARAYLESFTTKWKAKADDGRILYVPEWLAVDVISNFNVTLEMVEQTASYRRGETKEEYSTHIKAVPENVVSTAQVNVRVHGLQYARSARGSLTGMAEGWLLGLEHSMETTGTHVMEVWDINPDIDDETKGFVSAEFRTFGLPTSTKNNRDPESNRLYVSFLLRDNATISDCGFSAGNHIMQDIGDKTVELWTGIKSNVEQEPSMDCDPDKPVLLPFVEPEHGGDAGFQATIDDWGDVTEVEVPLCN